MMNKSILLYSGIGYKLPDNKKANTRCASQFVPVENSFRRRILPDKIILTLLIQQYQSIIKRLSTALSYDTCGDLLMPFYINDLANGIIIIMYALDDRRNKLKVKSALMLEPRVS